jgi:hypothetical protein
MKKTLTLIQILLVVAVAFLVRYVIISEPHYHQDHFVYYAPIGNQPNCVVGTFCMYAKEALNKEITPYFLETSPLTQMNKKGINVTDIEPLWNKVFPTNRLKCVYDLLDTNSYNNVLFYDKPYFWVGKLYEYHACVVYLHTNSVTYKHFAYNENTKTNYIVNAPYSQFFSNTLRLYVVK